MHLHKPAPHPCICILPKYTNREIVGTMPRSLEMFPNLSIISQPGSTQMLLSPYCKRPKSLANIHHQSRITAQRANKGVNHISRLAIEATTDRKVALRSSDDGSRRDILAHLTSGKATRVSPRSGVIPRRREEARVNQKIPEVSLPLISNKRRGKEYILQTHI